MKDDVKIKMRNETPKILTFLDGVANWDGVFKFNCRPKGDHAMHFLGWIEKPNARSLV